MKCNPTSFIDSRFVLFVSLFAGTIGATYSRGSGIGLPYIYSVALAATRRLSSLSPSVVLSLSISLSFLSFQLQWLFCMALAVCRPD